MGNKLLIRAFDVEVGDCFYVQIPAGRSFEDGTTDDFHMLIDCGSKGPASLLRRAVDNLRQALPEHVDGGGKKRLDLLVVSHEHEDHIKGFDPRDFADIHIERVWMPVAMDPEHPQAETMQELTGFATRAMRNIEAQGLALDPALADLMSLFSISNDSALDMLRQLPTPSNLKPNYVHAGMTSESLNLPLVGATIRVLGPEKDIDHFYLGEEGVEEFRAFQAAGLAFDDAAATSASSASGDSAAKAKPPAQPKNISAADFRGLRSRMLSNAFAFAELTSKVKNNASAVLLIEWQGRRLLFVGDAEWEHSFKEGKKNGGWNVMWHRNRELLDSPVDFLKIGHHGSTNSTPWREGRDDPDHEPTAILDAILPIPQAGGKKTAKALVSTKRKNYKTIPRSELLVELGKRVRNTRRYGSALTKAGHDPTQLRQFKDYEEAWLNKPQPRRTDLETLLKGSEFVDVKIDPVS